MTGSAEIGMCKADDSGICILVSGTVFIGFTLVTPTEKVVDLGTAFGIEVADSGATSVAVFEGEVELHGTKQPRLLQAGQSTIFR